MAKTLLFLNNFADSWLGGGEQYLMLLADAAREEGFRVVAACLPGAPIGETLGEKGFKVVDFNPARLNLPGTIGRLRSIVRGEAVDIVHANGFLPGLVARMSMKR